MKDESNKFQDTTSGNGFFKSYFESFRNAIDPLTLSNFAAIKNDEDRLIYVAEMLPDYENIVPEPNGGKDSEAAHKLKDKANSEFVRGDTAKSVKTYSDAIIKVPFNSESSFELAIFIANRSAALYHLEQFDEAIRDIDMSTALAYPRDLRYKALERKAKSLLALKKHREALEEFKKTLQALDDSKLPVDKKLQMQNNIQLMLNILTKPETKQGHVNAFVEGQHGQNEKAEKLPELSGKRNPTHPAISDKVAILEEERVGRYAAAVKDIEPGDTVAVEEAYCSVLLAEYALTHCVHCFVRTESPFPCSGCSLVIFCSSACRDAANSTYHKYECTITNALHSSGASVMVAMALRIISQKSLQFFLDLKDSLKNPRDNLKKYKSNDYVAVYHLVTHHDQRPIEDFFERTVMAVFLLRCLQRVGYFGEKNLTPTARPLNENEIFIGGLILRHLQILQFNAHEIAELETDCTEKVDKSTSIFLGGGLFPTLALFNHSCDPAVVRYFIGKTVIVRTIRRVREGELVAENYGPIFTVKAKKERQKSLRLQYWFDCGCQPCEENWPVMKEMDKKIIRFRCDFSGEPRCNGLIEVPFDTEDFIPKCKVCGRHTNILKGLKILQDTDAMFRQAALDTDRGNFKAALSLYLEILGLLDVHLVPPFPDYHICQQAVRKCMLSLGSKYKICG